MARDLYYLTSSYDYRRTIDIGNFAKRQAVLYLFGINVGLYKTVWHATPRPIP